MTDYFEEPPASRRATKLEKAKNRSLFRHREGKIINRCRCRACHYHRTAACTTIDDAIDCNGHIALDYAVAVIDECQCGTRAGPWEVFCDHWTSLDKAPRKRAADAKTAKRLLRTCCSACRVQIYAMLGHEYTVDWELFPTRFIFYHDFSCIDD